MGLFGKNTALVPLEDRLTAVENLCADLARKSRSLELEYTELYDKVRHQMSRMAKRSAVEQKENGEELVEEAPDDGLDPISRSIMLRRGMLRKKL